MILAGTRPPEYAAALRAERARRAVAVEPGELEDVRRDAGSEPTQESTPSAVDIAPRPPAD
jgi:hypothetical protein